MFPVSFIYYRVCVIVQCFLVVSTKLNDVCTILSAWSNYFCIPGSHTMKGADRAILRDEP